MRLLADQPLSVERKRPPLPGSRQALAMTILPSGFL
jgi:hypothetical protein